MSGGIAYVWDRRRRLERRYNLEMVDIEEIDDDDRETIRELVQRHVELTDSPVGVRALEALTRSGAGF